MRFLPDMHRITDQKADWERVPREQWTDVQRRAAETNGIDTPGNRETLKGLLGGIAAIVAVANERYLLGTILMGYSRYKDVKDGKEADKSDTKSPLGEIFDAFTDNALVAAGTPVFMNKGVLTETEGLAMGGVVAAKFVGSGVAKARGREAHATRIAKIGQFCQGIGVGGRLVWKTLDRYGFKADGVKKASGAVLWAGIGMSAISSAGYLATAFRRPNPQVTTQAHE